MHDRKAALRAAFFAGAITGSVLAVRRYSRKQSGIAVNDVQAQINPTRVSSIERPLSLLQAKNVVRSVRSSKGSVSIAGGRHAMGGQQFLAGQTLIDTRGLDKVLSFDKEQGQIEVEAGIQWPALVRYLNDSPIGPGRWWSIAQKQTGADMLALGGAVSANVHGRGLKMKPLIGDVVSITLIDAEGQIRECNREQNSELFRLAVGGYGLFGLIYSVRIRLVPRRKLERVVEVIDIDDLIRYVDDRESNGFLYGDFQFVTDELSDHFLRKGVFSCYRPVDDNTPIPDNQTAVTTSAWRQLIYLAHTDKAKAFKLYADYYLSTSGQIYWSDTHQLAGTIGDYHEGLDRRLGTPAATEIITEIFVPRDSLCAFMEEARQDFIRHGVNMIYGTIRMVERDDESFLAWARDRFAGIIFNLHTTHSPQGLQHSADAFRRLIDIGRKYGGTYYLTYHRYASAGQVIACYPQFTEFLEKKRQYDPNELFQSDWYRHHLRLIGEESRSAVRSENSTQ